MALLRLPFKPGVDKQNTEYGAEGGWVDSDYIRFRYGLPEKLGGWTDFGETVVNFVGLISDIFTWSGLDGEPYAAVGTNRKVYAFYGGAWADITPIRDTGSVTFTTVNGSTTVTVNDTAHGAIAGDFVTISATTGDPGGIPNASLNNEFEIQFVPNANTYTILSPTAATSTVAAAGTATATYQLNIGSDVSFTDFGWGVGTWSLSTWGTPRPASAEVSLFSRVWQFDVYGENLILQLVDGGVYEWLPSTGLATRATAVAGAPTKSKYALISTPDRHLVCVLALRPPWAVQPPKTPCLCGFQIKRTLATLWPQQPIPRAGNAWLTETKFAPLCAHVAKFLFGRTPPCMANNTSARPTLLAFNS